MSTLRARSSVSESAVGAGPREAGGGGSSDQFTELVVVDRSCEPGRLGTVFRSDLERRRSTLFGGLG